MSHANARITHVLLVLVLFALLAVIGMLATRSVAGPLDPPGAPASTMKTLDDIPGSWSRTLDAGDGAPGPNPPAGCDSSRFECLDDWSNALVLDRETGLVWQRSPIGSFPATWSVANSQCLNYATTSVYGFKLGSRLPTYEELVSLAFVTALSPWLPPGHPFTGVLTDDVYWTASTANDGSNTARAWSFDGIPSSELKTNTNYFWCVRGGQGFDGM